MFQDRSFSYLRAIALHYILFMGANLKHASHIVYYLISGFVFRCRPAARKKKMIKNKEFEACTFKIKAQSRI